MKIKKEIKGQLLNICLTFDQIENKDQYALVILCSICAYFMQNKINVRTDGKQSVFIDEVEIGNIVILAQEVKVSLYVDKIKHYVKNVNPTLVSIGLQTYFQIYFHLYDTGEFHQVEDFYLKVKKV